MVGGVEPELAMMEGAVVLVVYNIVALGVGFWLTLALMVFVHGRLRKVNAGEPYAYLLFRDSLRVRGWYGAEAPFDAPAPAAWRSMREGAL